MSPLMQIFVVVTILIFAFLAYAWRHDIWINVFIKFTLTMMSAAWTLYLLASLGYLGGK